MDQMSNLKVVTCGDKPTVLAPQVVCNLPQY